MTLQKRTFVWTGISGLLLLIGVFFVSSYVLKQGYADLEQQAAAQNVERVEQALNVELDNLRTKLSDWAIWDDTYYYLVDHNQDFVDSNLQNESLKSLKLNIMVFIGKNGQVITGKSVDGNTLVDTPLPKGLDEILTPDNALVISTPEGMTGIVDLSDGPYLIASRSVMKSDGTGPSTGTLMFGRSLTQEELHRLEVVTKINGITIIPVSDSVPADVAGILPELTRGAIVQNIVDKQILYGYKAINDIFGKQRFILRVTYPREIYAQGKRSIEYLLASSIVTGGAFLIFIMVFFDRVVVYRIVRLRSSLVFLQQQGDQSARIPRLPGNDEIAGLVENINDMLSSLEDTSVQLSGVKAQAQLYLDVVRVIVLVLDPESTVKLINARGCEVTGYTADELIGKNWVETCIPERLRETIASVVKGAFAGDKPRTQTYENPIVNKNGEERIIAWQYRTVGDNKNQTKTIICSGEDVTDLRAKESRLAERNAETELLNSRMVGRELRMSELKQEIEDLKKQIKP